VEKRKWDKRKKSSAIEGVAKSLLHRMRKELLGGLCQGKEILFFFLWGR